MSKNILLVVEGSKTEHKILGTIFKKYGFEVVIKPAINKDLSQNNELTIHEYSNSKDIITIVTGPHSRLKYILSTYDKNTDNFERFLNFTNQNFTATFFIYDVDHTSKEELTAVFNNLNDESSALLLVSSPCIEIISDINRYLPIQVEHIKLYKSERNIYCHSNYKMNNEEYIISNFERLILYYLEQNFNDFKEENIMEHPFLVINKINEENERSEETVNYRYFTTVIYVCIAFALGLTKEINNYQTVYNFFENKIMK